MVDPGDQTASRARFQTDRLVVDGWHNAAFDRGLVLTDVVQRILTPATTAHLPPSWQGSFDQRRAQRWIEERDAESPTMLAIDTDSGEPVGLLILHDALEPGGLDLRLGFVMAEAAWGRGLGSELVQGLVDWAAGQSEVVSISGGVSVGNPASARVMTKAGFVQVAHDGAETLYRRRLRA